MPTQTLTELFDKIKDDHNAHKIISLLHLMLHTDAERLDGGEQAPPPVCVQVEELLEQKAAVHKVSEKVDHQKVLLRQQEQRNKDVNAQLQELHSKFRLISEMNKRLFVKSKRLEGEYEELCLQNSAAKEEMEEQKSLILDLQQRLGSLEEARKQKDELLASEKKEKNAFKKEVGEICVQMKTVKEEVKEQRSLFLDVQQRLDRLEARRKQRDTALAVSQEAQKKKKEEEEKGKQSKAAHAASAKAEAEAKPKTRNVGCKEKVVACSRTGAKPRTAVAAAPKGQSDKSGTDKRAAADRRKPRISLDPRPNPKEAKLAKTPANPERRDSRLPPIHRDRTAPFHRARLKDTLLPGRFCSSRSGTLVPQGVHTSQETSLRTPVQALQDSAKTRTPKLPPLGSKALFPHHSSHKFTGARTPAEMLSAAPDSVEDRSPLFPVANVDFQRDEDFSPWEHERLVQSSNEDGEDNE